MVRPKLLLYSLLLATALLFGAAESFADPDSMQQRLSEMQPYMNSVRNHQNSVAVSNFGTTLNQIEQGNVPATVPGWMQGGDPKWYEGNDPLGILDAFFQDFLVNLGFNHFPSQFLDCFDFTIDWSNLCYKHVLGVPIPIGVKFTYRFPMQQILSKRFFQQRYLPSVYYQALKSSGIYEAVWNDAVKDVHAPVAKLRANVESVYKLNTKSYAAYIPTHGVLLPQANLQTASFPLDSPPQRARYDGGLVGGTDLNQLEYSIGPTLLHAAWVVVANYFPVLKLLPCKPPTKLPVPFNSEDPGFIHLTREPFMGFMLFRDTTIRQDLTNWLKNPFACQQWMMNTSRYNLPHNMMAHNQAGLPPAQFAINNPLSAAISLIPGSDALSPLSNSQLAQFDRMCTNNWGGSIPFTTVHQLSDTPFISAGKNFEKAIRLAVGVDRTFLSRSSAKNYFAYYALNKHDDAYQLTYPDEWECKSVGSPGKQPFGQAQALQKPTEFGLYSMTHWWRVPKCCLKFGQIANLVNGMAQFGTQGFPSGLTNPSQIFAQVNPPALPDMSTIMNLPSNVNIPNTGIPGMPNGFNLPSSGMSPPQIPNLPF